MMPRSPAAHDSAGDRAAPACSNCLKARPPKQCKFDVLKIRHSVYSAASEEEHEEPPAPQQAEYANISRGAQVHTEAATAMYLSSSAVPTAPHNPILDLHTRTESAPTLPEVHFQGPTSSPIPLNGPESPSYARHHPSDPLELHHGDVNRCSPGSAFGGSPIVYSSPGSTGTSQAPTGHRCVTDPLEQFVFEFYIGQAGPWVRSPKLNRGIPSAKFALQLDIASSDRHFGETVPRLALAHPVLYAACLAYASNVLCLTGQLDRDVYERFHDHAIATLIPLLSPNSDPRADEVLLATAVVLRMSEQFSELSEDGLHHLHGANSLFAMAKDQWSPASVDLRGVAFWTYVRESIRVCFLSEQACPFDLDTVDAEGGWVGHIPEEAWANRLTYLLARLCTACWGDADPVVRAAAREQIRIRLEEWRESVPPSFQPWYNSRDKYRAFPTMKFLSPWHGMHIHFPSPYSFSPYGLTRLSFCRTRVATVLHREGDARRLQIRAIRRQHYAST